MLSSKNRLLRLEGSSLEIARAVNAVSPQAPQVPPMERMQQFLLDKLYWKASPKKSFWCEADLQQLWKGEYAERILDSDEGRKILYGEKKYYKILSVLVHIGEFNLVELVQTCFLKPGFSDSSLPIKEEWLKESMGTPAGRKFYENQYKSIPIYIEDRERAHIGESKTDMPLPFETDWEIVGQGGSGDVYRARVPPRFIRKIRRSETTSNDNVSRLALLSACGSELR